MDIGTMKTNNITQDIMEYIEYLKLELGVTSGTICFDKQKADVKYQCQDNQSVHIIH